MARGSWDLTPLSSDVIGLVMLYADGIWATYEDGEIFPRMVRDLSAFLLILGSSGWVASSCVGCLWVRMLPPADNRIVSTLSCFSHMLHPRQIVPLVTWHTRSMRDDPANPLSL